MCGRCKVFDHNRPPDSGAAAAEAESTNKATCSGTKRRMPFRQTGPGERVTAYPRAARRQCVSTRSGDFHRRIVGNVHPDVNMRTTAEVPHERRPFQSPDIPNLVISQVAGLKERDAARVESALRGETAEHFIAARRAVRLDERFEHAFEMRFLIGRQARMREDPRFAPAGGIALRSLAAPAR